VCNNDPQGRELVDRFHSLGIRFGCVTSTDKEVGNIGVDGTLSRESSAYDRAVGGGEEDHGTRKNRVCNNDP
jgi:hypothetical protein